MANMMDYLDWRGDVTFDQQGINEVDNLIFSWICYVELEGIAEGISSGKTMTIREISDIFFHIHPEEEVVAEKNFTRLAAIVLRKCAETERYQNVKVGRYVNHIDEEVGTQFSAMCFTFAENQTYLGYRGTDNNIVGWKEDFRMSFETVPAQKEAVDYLNYVGSMTPGKLYIGGHSKGGNLSVYATMHSNDTILDKVVKIFNNDGPGFSKEVVSSAKHKKIADRVFTYVPKSSIIGMLLEHEEDYIIVDSTAKGPFQHDPMTWVIMGPHFVLEQERTRDSVIFDDMTRQWIDQMSEEERKQYVEDLFGIIDEAGVKVLADFTTMTWSSMAELINFIRQNQPGMEVMKEAGKAILTETKKAVTETAKIVTETAKIFGKLFEPGEKPDGNVEEKVEGKTDEPSDEKPED